MAVLNLKQISDKLNEEFAGDERRLIFWFDAKAEFVDDKAAGAGEPPFGHDLLLEGVPY